jgi:hypothetical protein
LLCFPSIFSVFSTFTAFMDFFFLFRWFLRNSSLSEICYNDSSSTLSDFYCYYFSESISIICLFFQIIFSFSLHFYFCFSFSFYFYFWLSFSFSFSF